MGIYSVSYWIWVAVSLYAAYLLCFCMYKVDKDGKKTDERITVPRIFYLLTLVVSFVPIANIIFGVFVIVMSIVLCYGNEDFYFKSWLLEKPKGNEKKE